MVSFSARFATGAVAALLTALLLAGCAPQRGDLESLASTKSSYNTEKRIAELPPASRDDPVLFGGPLDNGATFASKTWIGDVVVVNFWYAACPPCRAEAPLLAATASKYSSVPVRFIGVNVRDSADTARSFEKEFGITYPSILDQGSGAVQLAFSGNIAPNAVPTTLVLDRRGRVAAKIVGQIPGRSVLNALIDRVVAEKP